MSGQPMFRIASPSSLLLRARQVRRDKSGVTAVEFAIIAPLLIGMMMTIADLGLAIYTDVQLANAAQAGATYAMQKGYDGAGMTTVAQASTRLTGVTVATSQYCGCPSASGIASITCGSNCSDGLTAGTFAQISATKDYSTLISYPGVPASFHMVETATARTQ
jgi:Flp pilus assembly protein TadG